MSLTNERVSVGCATAHAPSPAPPPAALPALAPGGPPSRPAHRAQIAEGKASYYSQMFAGRKTASGERYDPERMTAAHKSLPLGTWVRVTRNDGRFVEVRINDRCGCGGGHIIDLSRAAARRLDMIRAGSVPVRVEVITR